MFLSSLLLVCLPDLPLEMHWSCSQPTVFRLWNYLVLLMETEHKEIHIYIYLSVCTCEYIYMLSLSVPLLPLGAHWNGAWIA